MVVLTRNSSIKGKRKSRKEEKEEEGEEEDWGGRKREEDWGRGNSSNDSLFSPVNLIFSLVKAFLSSGEA